MLFRLILFCSMCFTYTFVSSAQNLVPNYSFENNTGPCPVMQGQLFTTDWYSPNGQTTDFFTPCGLAGWYSTPDNSQNFGFQYAATGTNYVGIRAWDNSWGSSNSVIREYISVKLAEPLKACQLYYIYFKVSVANGPKTKWAVSNLGLSLSKDKVMTTAAVIQVSPQIFRDKAKGPPVLGQWETISGYYLAVGGEEYITIGNFETYDRTIKWDVVPQLYDGAAYYYIDDVSVTESVVTTSLDSTFCDNRNVVYKARLNPDSIRIQVNGETTVIDTNFFVIDQTGAYQIEEFQNNCSLQVTYNATKVNCDGRVQMPTLITPNGDLMNDQFEPLVFENIIQVTLNIYNRWGGLVYTSTNIKWNPSEVSDGIYYYDITYTDKKNVKGKYKGWVSVIR
ncbi:gliding motility-associated C-terminal domain-containing protein [Cytophaga aurantiaca]|uniref:T9SS type B sorting domain-containing protein n=1 Tax=Cytophaga aurantiaca TaxID=29530 RepID=UPI00039BB507|nr:gliding motility-associated C-terminal domain-containing protein [Cytophaga aurantiaca]